MVLFSPQTNFDCATRTRTTRGYSASYKLQKVALQNDPVNQVLAEAHAAVATNSWTAVQLGEHYKSLATESIDDAEALEYKKESIEY